MFATYVEECPMRLLCSLALFEFVQRLAVLCCHRRDSNQLASAAISLFQRVPLAVIPSTTLVDRMDTCAESLVSLFQVLT